MNFNDMLVKLQEGSKIRRPHWKKGSTIILEKWNHMLVVSIIHDFKTAYSFPYGDVIATDWEILQ